ncbi:MAG TPA: hypothetical protein VMV10_30530 [Pirellulales bacterium]|nr:hypothetical protein [Pirellulales bacterium]
MSIGPLGPIISAAGSSLAQSKGSELERTQNEVAGQQRQTEVGRQAESAAGIGAADGENHETSERDADGRRLWEAPLDPKNAGDANAAGGPEPPRAKDPTGQSGGHLDLSV